jgi:serine/threonine-protein kinase
LSSSTNTLGKYQIIREIARSNDIVYEAIDPSINRRIALKELFLAQPHACPEARKNRAFPQGGKGCGEAEPS